MTKKMLINSSHPEECRVAVVVDGELDELDIKTGPKEATVGNIYKGVITDRTFSPGRICQLWQFKKRFFVGQRHSFFIFSGIVS